MVTRLMTKIAKYQVFYDFRVSLPGGHTLVGIMYHKKLKMEHIQACAALSGS